MQDQGANTPNETLNIENIDLSNVKNMTTEEMLSYIDKMQGDLDLLNAEAKAIEKRTGMSKKELEAYINNPANFSSENWQKLQEAKEETRTFLTNIWNVFDKDLEEVEKERDELENKKQKQKLKNLNTKKNWIPVS